MSTKIHFDFYSKKYHAPWFSISKEYWVDGKVEFAEVLFCIWPKWSRKLQGFNH